MTFGETWTRETVAYGGFADAIGGVATIVLPIRVYQVCFR